MFYENSKLEIKFGLVKESVNNLIGNFSWKILMKCIVDKV